MIRRNPIIAQDLAAIAALALPWETLHGRRVLITGSTGFLGSYLVEVLAYLNEIHPERPPIQILAMARNPATLAVKLGHLAELPFFQPIIQDIAKPWESDAGSIDYIVHTASPASPKYYLATPVDTIRANVQGTLMLLELARAKKTRVLFLSSGAIYGQPIANSTEINETDYGPLDPLDPRSCYGESKRLAEAACLAYWREFEVPTVIARVSHTYGPGIDLNDGRIFSDVIAGVLHGENIRLHGDGQDARPFCYVSDMTTGLFLLLLRGQAGEAYNIGATEELTVRDLAELVIRIGNRPDLKILCNTLPGRYGHAARSSGHFNIEKIQKLGWKITVQPEQGFTRTLEYFKKNT